MRKTGAHQLSFSSISYEKKNHVDGTRGSPQKKRIIIFSFLLHLISLEYNLHERFQEHIFDDRKNIT